MIIVIEIPTHYAALNALIGTIIHVRILKAPYLQQTNLNVTYVYLKQIAMLAKRNIIPEVYE